MTEIITDDLAAAIAEGLSIPQQNAVLHADYQQARGAWWPAGNYVNADKRIRRTLCAKGIIKDYLNPTQRLTPLGLKVKVYLENRP